jgi:uncharacterized membrane protein
MFASHLTRGAARFHSSQQFERIILKLPEDKRHVYRERLEKMEQANRTNWDNIRKLKEESSTILIAENFDALAYQQKIDELSSIGGNMRRGMYDIITDMARDMPQDDRKHLVKVLQGMRSRR